jgi:uncharacterized protein
MNAFNSATLTIFSIWLIASTPLVAQEAALRKEDSERRRTLTVTGNGEVNANPDQAVVRLGVTAQETEAAASQSKVNEVMQTVLAQIEKAGIPRRSIRTTALVLTPIYAPQKPDRAVEPKVVAYRAANTVEVTVDDIKKVGDVIDAGLRAGANRLEGVSFGLKNDLSQRTTALARAVEEARAKAQAMARALDVSLGNVREVVEGGVHIFRQESLQRLAARGMMGADAMQTPVEAGEVRVQASVTIHYDLAVPK